ncbi:MAG TPA: preprotein translocase subunit SecE [Candidatus Saccharimonadales bacterium]|nr:preprotein translocase subunit SecE [Candidatus Saccharimonadales bacterium]
MANVSPRGRKPRIRKAAPTVREKIESGSTEQPKAKSKVKTGFSSIFWPFKLMWRVLARIFRPLSPVGRLLKKVFRWMVPRYFINAWKELKLVTWPNRSETWKLTSAVFVFALVFGILVTVVDLGLDQIFKRFILK